MQAELPDRLVCSTLCFRRLSLAEALAAAREAGFGAVEIGGLPGYCGHWSGREGEGGGTEEWRRTVRAGGLRVHSFNLAFGPILQEARRSPWETARAALADAEAVGARLIVVSPGEAADRDERAPANSIQAAGEAFRPWIAEADARGVAIAFEAPHRGGPVRTVDEALALVAACAPAPAGLVLDVAHILRSACDLPTAVTRIGDRIRQVHLRDQSGGRGVYPLGTGEVDFGALRRSLDRVGYAGALTLEFPDAAPDRERMLDLLRASRNHLETCLSP